MYGFCGVYWRVLLLIRLLLLLSAFRVRNTTINTLSNCVCVFMISHVCMLYLVVWMFVCMKALWSSGVGTGEIITTKNKINEYIYVAGLSSCRSCIFFCSVFLVARGR